MHTLVHEQDIRDEGIAIGLERGIEQGLEQQNMQGTRGRFSGPFFVQKTTFYAISGENAWGPENRPLAPEDSVYAFIYGRNSVIILYQRDIFAEYV